MARRVHADGNCPGVAHESREMVRRFAVAPIGFGAYTTTGFGVGEMSGGGGAGE